MADAGSSFILDGLVRGVRLLVSLDPEVYATVWISVYVAVSSTCIASLIGVPAGLAVALRKFRGRRLVITTLNTLFALPTVLVGLVCYSVLCRRGPLGTLGWLFTPKAMIAGQVLLIVPLIAALTVAAVSRVDRRVMREATALGATRLRATWQVVMEGRSALLAAIFAGFGRVFSEVGISVMVGGNIYGRTRSITTTIATQASMGEFDQGVALGIVLLAVAFVISVLLYRLQGHTP